MYNFSILGSIDIFVHSPRLIKLLKLASQSTSYFLLSFKISGIIFLTLCLPTLLAMFKIVEISEYKNDQKRIKKFVLETLSEFGFKHNPQYDRDLEDITSYYQHPHNFWILLENQKKIIGTIAVVKIKPKVAELKRFYVDKAYRSRGLGKTLFEKAINFCQKNHLQTIILESTPNMIQAIKFYTKHGFTTLRQEKGHVYFKKTLEF